MAVVNSGGPIRLLVRPVPAATSEIFIVRCQVNFAREKQLLADGRFAGEPTRITIPFQLTEALGTLQNIGLTARLEAIQALLEIASLYLRPSDVDRQTLESHVVCNCKSGACIS